VTGAGAPAWDFAIVAYVDILGFSDLVETDAKGAAPKNLERLVEALGAARAKGALAPYAPLVFSDSIILTADMSPGAAVGLVAATRELQREFVLRQILVRGAISFGKHHRSDIAVYSEGLVRAYRLETTRARFPRIVVDPQLWDWLSNHPQATPEAKAAARASLAVDRDKMLFLSYLEVTDLEAHKALVAPYIADPTRLAASTILEKVQWVAEYHNYVAEKAGVPLQRIAADFLRFTAA
jgi:hypothetical protein